MGYYELEVAGLKRSLPIVNLGNNVAIASFVMLGDSELNCRCAQEFLNIFPGEFDYLVVPEAKAIGLAQAICQMSANESYKDYIVLRKGVKAYMNSPIVRGVRSITTSEKQVMVLAREDAEKMGGKRVYTIDDVVSTGSSYNAMIDIVQEAGGKIGFSGAVLREGRFDISSIEKKIGFPISFLGNLPLFKT